MVVRTLASLLWYLRLKAHFFVRGGLTEPQLRKEVLKKQEISLSRGFDMRSRNHKKS